LAEAAAAKGEEVEVVLDLDVGQHRTGIALGDAAADLYRWIAGTKGLKPGGLHAYDGHNHQSDVGARQQAVDGFIGAVCAFADRLQKENLPVPRIISGGTGSFPILAAVEDPRLELSPGTTVLHDIGYQTNFADLKFIPAAAVLTRIISCPGTNRLTCDVGYKALGSDPPLERRLRLHEIPDAKPVMHNEEHLVVETSRAAEFEPGDALLAFPWHVCPTVALHQQAYIVAGGKVIDCWPIEGRERVLSV
jgi:D-serine deaminase-like pyridoxal phosphate-dependent protein